MIITHASPEAPLVMGAAKDGPNADPQPPSEDAVSAIQQACPGLSNGHAGLIAASSISPAVAAARGYRTVRTKAEIAALGFSPAQRLTPALLIPVHGVGGDRASYQLRPDSPRIVIGKPLKYETPKGSRMALDVPPAARLNLGNPAVPLLITEGARKADAAVSVGLCCIALLGVWNFRGENEDGGLTALADWELIALKSKAGGREVYIIFDSDVMTKPAVAGALRRLKAFLQLRGARVRVVYLPADAGGVKVGLDDFLAAGHSVDELLALSTDHLRQSDPDPNAPAESPYRMSERGFEWRKQTSDGPQWTPLGNFTATITADVAHDDGVELRRVFEMQGAVKGRAPVVLACPRRSSPAWPGSARNSAPPRSSRSVR